MLTFLNNTPKSISSLLFKLEYELGGNIKITISQFEITDN